MPDLSGKTISEAIYAMNRAGLNIKVSGTGTVFRQQHEPGASERKAYVKWNSGIWTMWNEYI